VTVWQAGRYRIDLSRPRLMGIVNITPDSFFDGGLHRQTAQAIAHCERLVSEGADILDLGGESTRPGAAPVDLVEERARVLPVLRQALQLGVPVSVDTRRCALMREALDAGADIINDVHALRDKGAEALLAGHGSAGICLMHMRGEPATMQQAPQYADVVGEVAQFLAERAASLQARGVQASRIVIDPGFGFGKTDAHQVALHRALPRLKALGFPVLVGWSRKSTLGRMTGRPVHERLPASLAAALSAVYLGAKLLRVHDVAATADALKVWQALHRDAAPQPQS
jgi:dihydropteroate synthase